MKLFKHSVLVALFLPGLWAAFLFLSHRAGPRPLTEMIHETGLWGLRFLFLTLAITPARQLLQWPRLIAVRRRLGVASFAYIAVHLTLYAADQMFDLGKVTTEILHRIYLTIGFVALLGLSALAATSTDGMIRRLGPKAWRRLHRTAYMLAFLGTIHFFMQSKLDVREPVIMAGLYVWLMASRLLPKLTPAAAALLSLAAALATALGEAVYYWLKTGISPLRVLAANLSFIAGPRPAWIVLAVACLFTGSLSARSWSATYGPPANRRSQGLPRAP